MHSVTVDIWSDRVMRSNLGITCHVVAEKKDNIELKSLLSNFKRFSSRHTGQHIASTFESEL